jgi:hypothetical protein
LKSKTPAAKSIPILVRPQREAEFGQELLSDPDVYLTDQYDDLVLAYRSGRRVQPRNRQGRSTHRRAV